MERRGVTLLLVVLVLSALLAISISIFSLVFGEFRISGEISDSFVAFYAADRGMEKLLYMDRVADSVPGCGGSGACQWPQPPDSPASFNLENGACFRLLYRRLGSGDAIAIAGGEYRCGIAALSVHRAAEMTYNKSGGAGGVAEFGDGRDQFAGVAGPGFKNINLISTIVGRTPADAVSYPVERSLSAGDDSIRIDCCDPNGIEDGDEVLIINLQGRPGATAGVGLWETQRVDQVTGRTIRLEADLTNSYDGTRYKVMLQRIPNYDQFTVLSGQRFGADSWGGTNGGVFFIRVAGRLEIEAGGEIDMVGRGYRGGGSQFQGEGRPGPGVVALGSNDGGGGGGKIFDGGGGGAGHRNNGSNGGTDPALGWGWGGSGGMSYGDVALSRIFLGSGGGGGYGLLVGRGGDGGGIVYVAARNLANNGAIRANASNPVADDGIGLGFNSWTGSGGGSGGSLFIRSDDFNPGGTVENNGTIGLAGNAFHVCGGFPAYCYNERYSGGDGSMGWTLIQ